MSSPLERRALVSTSAWITAAVAVAAPTWLLLPAFGPRVLLWWLPFAFLLVWRRRAMALWFFVASPLVALPPLSAWRAATSYAQGTATLHTVGLLRRDAFNRELGLRITSSGCSVSGAEPLWQVPHNLTLRALVHVLGPMRAPPPTPIGRP